MCNVWKNPTDEFALPQCVTVRRTGVLGEFLVSWLVDAWKGGHTDEPWS